MTKSEYRKLLEPQRQDAAALVKLLDKYGVGNGKRFMANWEEIWQENYATCVNNTCGIHG